MDFGEKKPNKLRIKLKLGKIWICPNCNKNFLSRNSLYGHMKTHPERDYRGMNPPSDMSPDSTIEEPEFCSSSRVDLVEFLDDFPVVRRSRSTGRNQDVIDAAETLILLSNHQEIRDAEKAISSCRKNIAIDETDEQFCFSDLGKKRKRMIKLEEDYAKNCCRLTDVAEIREAEKAISTEEQFCYSDLGKKRKRIIKLEDYPKNCCSFTDVAEIEEQNCHAESGKKRRRIIKLEVDNPSREYKCTICSKIFPTPQSLGGHKSSAHNKKMQASANQGLMLEFGGLGGVISDVVVAAPVSHVCKVCDMSFKSGQALGGHMRRHYQVPTPTPVVSSDQSGVINDVIKEPVLGFDLNEMPEDGDSEEQQWMIW